MSQGQIISVLGCLCVLSPLLLWVRSRSRKEVYWSYPKGFALVALAIAAVGIAILRPDSPFLAEPVSAVGLAAMAAVMLLGGLSLVAWVVVFRLQFAALAVGARTIGLDYARGIRFAKMDKESVVLVSLQKSGSTLLCYIAALLNTRDGINNFRNDFDLIPMLSLPQGMINQNFNARQDGKYQLYKINSRMKDCEQPFEDMGIKRLVCTFREFSGYYRSVYWWTQEFYPRASGSFAVFRLVSWNVFKKVTFKKTAADHVEELRYVYDRLKSPSSHKTQVTAVCYEHLVKDKLPTLQKLASALEIETTPDMLRSIANKTSKESMSDGDKFDPVGFGEGNGVNKVNLHTHAHELTKDEVAYYNALFEARFQGTGITSYAQLVAELNTTAAREKATA